MNLTDLVKEPGTHNLSLGRCAFGLFFFIVAASYIFGRELMATDVALLTMLLGYNVIKKLPIVQNEVSTNKPPEEIKYETKD